MERLTLEALARLVDEAPTPEEQAVLDADPEAARELETLRAQREALGDLPSVLPAEAWQAVEAKLLSAGLIRAPVGRAASPTSVARVADPVPAAVAAQLPWRWWRPAAAALIVFAAGTAAGWAAAPGGQAAFPAGAGIGARAVVDEPAPPRTLEDARLAVQAAERRWITAHNHYWGLVDARQPQVAVGDPAARLAALEALVAVGRAAVAESPSDAFFNGFLVSTLAQQQQTLRQISRAGWY